MTATNPARKKPGTHNLKLLLTTLSLSTTLSGWAVLSSTQAQTVAQTAPPAEDPPAPIEAPSEVKPLPTELPVEVERVRVIIPSLASLPVRGLREVGEPVQPAAPQAVVVQQVRERQENNQQQRGGGSAAAQRSAPAPRPAPPPVTNSGGSRP